MWDNAKQMNGIAATLGVLVAASVLWAGAAWVDLTLRVTRRRLDLLVGDDADGRPVLVEADDDATRGRGLGIVDHLADAWEVTPRPRGKLVTATWQTRADAPG